MPLLFGAVASGQNVHLANPKRESRDGTAGRIGKQYWRGKLYEAQKMAEGAPVGNTNNAKSQTGQK